LYTIKKIEEIDRLFEITHSLIIRKLPHIRKETVEKIFEQPYTSPKKIMGQDIKSLNTAKKYLNQMEELGINAGTRFTAIPLCTSRNHLVVDETARHGIVSSISIFVYKEK